MGTSMNGLIYIGGRARSAWAYLPPTPSILHRCTTSNNGPNDDIRQIWQAFRLEVNIRAFPIIMSHLPHSLLSLRASSLVSHLRHTRLSIQSSI